MFVSKRRAIIRLACNGGSDTVALPLSAQAGSIDDDIGSKNATALAAASVFDPNSVKGPLHFASVKIGQPR